MLKRSKEVREGGSILFMEEMTEYSHLNRGNARASNDAESRAFPLDRVVLSWGRRHRGLYLLDRDPSPCVKAGRRRNVSSKHYLPTTPTFVITRYHPDFANGAAKDRPRAPQSFY